MSELNRSRKRSCSKSSVNEHLENGSCSRKRRRSIDTNGEVSNRVCGDLEQRNGLQYEFTHDLSQDLEHSYQTPQHWSKPPHNFIALMYRLDLAILCSLRKLKYEHKYPFLSFSFQNSEIDKFNTICLRHEDKVIFMQVEYVNKCYDQIDITFADLFTRKERNLFYLNDYFNSFFKYVISPNKSGNLLNDIEYLIIYTNSGLNLTRNNELRQGKSENAYPFEFFKVSEEKCGILHDFLSKGDDNIKEGDFYHFKQDKTTRKEFIKQLEFSPAMQEEMKEKNLSREFEKKIKRAFFAKLVFAVNQPCREEMNRIVRNEIEHNKEAQVDYISLQEKILRELPAPGQEIDTAFGNNISVATYSFNLLISSLHSMFLQESIFSLNFEENSDGKSNDIAINCRDRISHVRAFASNSDIGYGQLFPGKGHYKNNLFSINKHFEFFVEGLKSDIRYFIILTNAKLKLTEENVLKKASSGDFVPLKFKNIDVQKKKYKFFKYFSFFNVENLYQFAQEDTTRDNLLSLLKLPPSLQKKKRAGRLSEENENEIKLKFLDKLIIADNQVSSENLTDIIRNEIEESDVSYNYETLHEIALRWLESGKFDQINKEIMEKLLADIQNDRSQNKNIDEEFEYAGSEVSGDRTYEFDQERNNSMSSFKENTMQQSLSVTDQTHFESNSLWEDSELHTFLQDESRQDLADVSYNPIKISKCRCTVPYALIRLMYRIDLYVLCSLRNLKYKQKYPSLSLIFEDSKIEKFNNIVFRNGAKSIYVQIVNVDKYYKYNGVSYDDLFCRLSQSYCYINKYFNSLIKYLTSNNKSVDSLKDDIEYFVIYTYSSLDLTDEETLKATRSRNFYPFKFDRLNKDKCDIIQNFLFTSDDNNLKKGVFYQLTQDEITREEFFKRLAVSSIMQREIKQRQLSEEFVKEIKGAFLDRLVFAVNQPSREKMNSIVRNEIEENTDVQDDYIDLQEKILRSLTAPEIHKRLGDNISGTTYAFKLLVSCLHSMFLQKSSFTLNYEENKDRISNDIIINYKDRISHIRAYTSDSNIGYGQLFPPRRTNVFSLNKQFEFFIEGLKNDIRYFIVFTDAKIELTEDKVLKKNRFKDFFPFQFKSIDIQKKKYKILKQFSFINEKNLYQFAKTSTTRENLLRLLKVPPSLQKEKDEGRLSEENENEIKHKFLDKLIIADNQVSRENLNCVMRNEIENSDVPYNFEQLHEIALRWAQSREFGHITTDIIKKLLADIKNNRPSYQEIENKNIEEFRFAKIVVGTAETSALDKFFLYLIEGEGQTYMEVLKKHKVLTCVSSILKRAGINAVPAFKGLYHLWFDDEGNKTHYLTNLEDQGIKLEKITRILCRSGADAVEAFKDLYNLWINTEGTKTVYLKTLEKEGIKVSTISNMLGGARTNAVAAFKNVYNLLFDAEGNKTKFLETLKKEDINLSNISYMSNDVGNKAANILKELYDLWFDADENKTQYLKTLEKEGLNLADITPALSRTGVSTVKTFESLFSLLFDVDGNKSQYLKTLDKENIDLKTMSLILCRAGNKIVQAFKDLYHLWFNKEGDKTQYLQNIEKEGIDLASISVIIGNAGSRAAKAFKDLYDLWFDATGNKTKYLKKTKKNLANISTILHQAGTCSAKTIKDLLDLWYNEKGKKSKYVKVLEKEGMNLNKMCHILFSAGRCATKSFRDLYDLWFDAAGNKTQYLKTLENNGIPLSLIYKIIYGTGYTAGKHFKDFYDLFFDEEGNTQPYVEHFVMMQDEGQISTLRNLAGVLDGAGAKFKYAFGKLHSACFNAKGKSTKLFNDFFNAGFTPNNLLCILCRSGVNAATILIRLHSVCFDKEGEESKLLKDFLEIGFRPSDLCSILSGSADSLEKFHEFCFTGEGKIILNTFFSEGFTPKILSKIFAGAKGHVCNVLINFHDVCFCDNDNKTKLLDDFYEAGFRPSDLSRLLSMTGTGAPFILKKFHKLCFNKNNYLNHFLEQKELFTPKKLSKVLEETNICVTFDKLHEKCFDGEGNKTKFLNDLIENNPSKKILHIVFEKVRTASPATNEDDTIVHCGSLE